MPGCCGSSAALGLAVASARRAQPAPLGLSSSTALARLSMPDLLSSARSLSRTQKKPLLTISLASAARSLCPTASTTLLRKVWNAASVKAAGGDTATGSYGLIGAGGGGGGGGDGWARAGGLV